jgi:hypothetical protein
MAVIAGVFEYRLDLSRSVYGTERGGEPILTLGDNKGLDTSLIVPPLWRSLGVTLWQF